MKIVERPDYREFESYVIELFKNAGFNIEVSRGTASYDFIMSKDGIRYIVDVKYYRSNSIANSSLRNAAYRMMAFNHAIKEEFIIVVPTSCLVCENSIKVNDKIIYIWTIENLLFFANTYELKSKLAQFTDVSLEQLSPKPPLLSSVSEDYNALGSQEKIANEVESKCDEYIKIFQSGQQKDFTTYEKVCCEALMLLFEDHLCLWGTQKTSNDNLYRFDTVCRIRENITSAFWHFIEEYFNSKYIIFEYKNYSNPITQKEVYTTARYLYSKAFRNVAIIIAVEGNDTENSYKAAKGVLREEGKLIILLSNDDMVKMLKKKKDNEDPSDYLYDKLDNMMIELEK
ncbi:restriction endonuclease [Ruminococcus albus]|uniref:Restriction endonuclease n=1 Tax=Ruminococcus albus TaxID=1264 RepID=A0A1H7P9R6_RUMAL|nr:restriction endonuclease [Ruminococcus albus]SEL32389.1 Restriction endonuclease [Ruminococcus albus]